jgi:hypothetical protein
MGYDPSRQVNLVLRTLLVKKRVITSWGESTSRLVMGESYGLGTELVRNYALWPIEVYVQHKVNSVDLITFRDGRESCDFTAELLPNHGLPEVADLLICLQSSGTTAEIRTEILLASGESDVSTLKLELSQ